MDEQVEENIVEKADKAAQRIEDANKVAAEILAKNQAIESRRILGGRTEGGKAPEPKKEISNREYAEAALRGRILK